jgi:hypothetical protein
MATHGARLETNCVQASAPAAGLSPSMFMPSIAVVGASNEPRKHGKRAVRGYLARGWTVFPVDPREPAIEGRARPSQRRPIGPQTIESCGIIAAADR